jgi:hypothetical protein
MIKLPTTTATTTAFPFTTTAQPPLFLGAVVVRNPYGSRLEAMEISNNHRNHRFL